MTVVPNTRSSNAKGAVVLLSGGLDSAVTLYLARAKGYDCHCLCFDYGQRHRRELFFSSDIAAKAGCALIRARISLPWKGSSLLDKNARLPEFKAQDKSIPSTYVPGRNIIFVSFALSYAESIGARHIFIGAHAQDYSGYPDCRPEFYKAFQKAADAGTKAGVEGRRIKLQAPLLEMGKADIIRLGARLGVPFRSTWSCYKGGKKPCGECDSCHYRAKGFAEAGLADPLLADL